MFNVGDFSFPNGNTGDGGTILVSVELQKGTDISVYLSIYEVKHFIVHFFIYSNKHSNIV